MIWVRSCGHGPGRAIAGSTYSLRTASDSSFCSAVWHLLTAADTTPGPTGGREDGHCVPQRGDHTAQVSAARTPATCVNQAAHLDAAHRRLDLCSRDRLRAVSPASGNERAPGPIRSGSSSRLPGYITSSSYGSMNQATVRRCPMTALTRSHLGDAVAQTQCRRGSRRISRSGLAIERVLPAPYDALNVAVGIGDRAGTREATAFQHGGRRGGLWQRMRDRSAQSRGAPAP